MSARADHESSSNMQAIAAMVLSQAVFTVNDSLMKLAARILPGGQAIFIRGLFTIVLAVALAAALGALGSWRPLRRQWGLVSVRSLAEVGATLLYLTALFNMPIADATAILQVLPLAITAGAALFLGEPVGWRRWLATLVGFLGVIVIIRPGTSAFNAWSLVALASVGVIVVRDLTTRRIDRSAPTVLLTVLSSLTVTAAASSLSLTETWQQPSPEALLLIGAAAVFLLGGYYFVIEAMRLGDVATVAPFRYSVILWAIIAGLVVFGERPDPLAMLGTAIVMAAGLYTFYRERQLRLQRGQA
ncbi:MAG: DMT family transporter [Hyphomicrobiaceae bacterium]|nr:DMT family transporter [Hyphomicrobiaceae bacterium]